MARFKLTGNYGTFTIVKVVEAEHIDDAWMEAGIMAALEAEGWDFPNGIDGEDWDVEEVTS